LKIKCEDDQLTFDWESSPTQLEWEKIIQKSIKIKKDKEEK